MQHVVLFINLPSHHLREGQDVSVLLHAQHELAKISEQNTKIETLCGGAYRIPLHNGLPSLCEMIFQAKQAGYSWKAILIDEDTAYLTEPEEIGAK